MKGRCATHTSRADVAGPTRGEVVWTKKLGTIQASGSITIAADGTLYVPTFEGVRALDSSGADLWSAKMNDAQGTAVAADGTLRVVGLSEITALGPDGATRWTYRGCTTSSQSAPAVAADAATLFTCNDGAVISLDDAGHVRWRTALAEVATVSPTIGPSGDFLVKGNDLASLAPDGSIRWRDGNVDSFASDIAVEDGLLFLAGGETVAAYRDDGSLVWLHEENKARFRQVAITAAGTVVTCASDSVVAFSRSGAVLWRAPVKDGRALAADAAGNVFVATFAKTIHALGPDGSVRWTFDTRDELPGGFAIGGDGTLYAFDRKSVYAIR